MAVTVAESFKSRRISYGQNGKAKLVYEIGGTDDHAEAYQALIAEIDTLFDPYGGGVLFWPRTTIDLEPINNDSWRAEVVYELTASTIPEASTELSFDTTGGSEHITQNIDTIGKYAPVGKTPIDAEGAIGITESGVQGLDIPVPVYRFSERHVLDSSVVTQAYRITLRNLTGKVNNASFKGFDAGEVLFEGAAGRRRGDGKWDVDFSFAASENRESFQVNVPVSPDDIITVDSKKGWEYLEVHYASKKQDLVGGEGVWVVQRPVSATVHKVFYDADFSLLGIGVT